MKYQRKSKQQQDLIVQFPTFLQCSVQTADWSWNVCMKQVYEKRRDGFNGSIEILSELQWGWVDRVSVHRGSWLRDPAARDRG